MFLFEFVHLLTGYLPSRLPTSCLTMAPRFDTLAKSESLHRRPLLELNGTESKQFCAWHFTQTVRLESFYHSSHNKMLDLFKFMATIGDKLVYPSEYEPSLCRRKFYRQNGENAGFWHVLHFPQ